MLRILYSMSDLSQTTSASISNLVQNIVDNDPHIEEINSNASGCTPLLLASLAIEELEAYKIRSKELHEDILAMVQIDKKLDRTEIDRQENESMAELRNFQAEGAIAKAFKLMNDLHALIEDKLQQIKAIHMKILAVASGPMTPLARELLEGYKLRGKELHGEIAAAIEEVDRRRGSCRNQPTEQVVRSNATAPVPVVLSLLVLVLTFVMFYLIRMLWPDSSK